ncbi:hypothetical protein PBI_DEWDROP_96 [Microbacterium phage Dewdrop]|nr:hypothetical protein PBI_LEAF_96 [Microbacterium phage Leaf]QGZ17464.1 hypothetical protein PBI_DEWDROP_96 [Microbacterium phage Dewdrop]
MMDEDEYRRRSEEVARQYRERKERQRAERRQKQEAEAAAESQRVRERAAAQFMARAHAEGRAMPGTEEAVDLLMQKSPLEQLIHMDVMVYFITQLLIRIWRNQHPEC